MRRFALSLVLLLVPLSAQPQSHAELARAEALIRQGRAEEAWKALSVQELQRAGDPRFDYLLGVAALESGRPSLATFVLERVIAVNPGHMAARLEMGRAYFALNDYERAQVELQAVLRSGPSPADRALIERYLARIEGRPRASSSRLSGHVEAALGRDRNVNAAGSAGGVVVAAPRGRREADEYFGLGAELAYAREIGGPHTLFAAAKISRRTHFDLGAHDSLAADLRAGVQRRLGARDSVQLSLAHEEYDSDDIGRRRIQGVAAEWTRALGGHADLGFFGEALRIRYRAAGLREESSNLLLGGVRGTRALDAPGRTVLSASAYAGHDEAAGARTDGDRRLFGASLTLTRRLASVLEARLSLAASQSEYDSARRDRYASAAIGASWRLERGWWLRPELSRMHNRSSVPFNEYGRTELSISLRRTLP